MRTLFLALSLSLTSSCVTPQAFIPPGRTVNFSQYRATKLVVVDSVNTPYSKEGIPMFEGLLRGRLQSLGFSVVERDEDLRVEVNITSFEPGSRAVSLIVGFGAGRAVLNYRAIFKERSGSVIAEFEGGKSYYAGELTLKEESTFMTDEEIKMGMIQHSIIQVGQFIKDNSLQVAGLDEGKEAFKRRDYQTAMRELLPLAEQGVAEAQLRVGIMYADGQGVAANPAEAAKWLQRAAEQGLADAQTGLGDMYFLGIGLAKSDGEAVKWYRRAAEQGHPQAQFNLASMYSVGSGVTQDYVLAYMWCTVSAKSTPNGEAVRRCDRIAPRMTKDEIARAKELASKFVPRQERALRAPSETDR